MENSIKIFSSGDIFRDFGVIQLSDLLGEYCELKPNYLIIREDLQVEELFNRIKKSLIEKKKIEFYKSKNFSQKDDDKVQNKKKEEYLKSDIISFPFMRNSPKWGNFGNISVNEKQEKVNGNIREMTRLLFLEQRNKYDKNYNYSEELCSICNQSKVPRKDFTKKRIISNSLYPLKGSEKSDFSNYGKESFEVCFSCEFLALLSYLKYINTSETVFYSRDLKMTKDLNSIFNANRNILTEEEIVKKIINFNKLNFNEFKFIYKGNQFTPEFLNTYTIESLLGFYQLNRIIDKFRFDGDKFKKEGRDFLIQNLRSKNYKYVQGVLLSQLIKKGEENSTIYNLKLYIKFIKIIGGEMENSPLNIFNDGKKLRNHLLESDGEDDGKIKRLSLKLIQLMKSNDRNTLLEVILHSFMVNKAKIPYKFTEYIMEGSDNQLHLYLGSFIEGLNSYNNSEKKEGE